MTGEVLAALAAAGGVVGSAGVGAFVTWRRDRGLEETETAKAIADGSSSAGQLALSIAKDLREQVNEQGVKIEQQNVRIATLEHKNTLWSYWYMDLRTGWAKHRLQDMPPKAPDV